MRSTLEMLEKKEAHLETKIAAEVALARQHAVTNKSRKQIYFLSISYYSCTDGIKEEKDVRESEGACEGCQIQP